ncbi:S100P-binding protein-like [Morone saxatilis]|uniref:S100P-binding protein-like n=1 Tax=Morone saxatilis TaxID=34816 RepID=UPI0015E1FC1B|nr:S100P-binding protein-like [Morone saxatilis]
MLPLQVQVKSVIVAPRQQPSSSKPAAHPLPGLDAAKGDSRARSQRPVVLDREVERDKRLYLQSVTRHLNGAAQDVMTELLKLMSHVADQTPASYGKQWQHPSDLTRRNYQQRFQNILPKVALHEWHAKNGATHKRFARVPKIFERSQFP